MLRSIQRNISTLLFGLTDAFAPKRCISCLIEGTWFCTACRQQSPPYPLRCIGCEQERPRGTTCRDCREDIPLTGVVAAGPYSHQALSRGIEWLKFKGVRPIANVLAALLIPRLASIAPIERLSQSALLVPIPLHPKRYRSRGFNQSEDIAHAIETICSIQVAPLLLRSRATASQARLPHELRPHNVDRAFSLALPETQYRIVTQEKPILIFIDDVSTTGSTFIAAASALPASPDVELWGAAVAQG